jgi:hypothetical protein
VSAYSHSSPVAIELLHRFFVCFRRFDHAGVTEPVAASPDLQASRSLLTDESARNVSPP